MGDMGQDKDVDATGQDKTRMWMRHGQDGGSFGQDKGRTEDGICMIAGGRWIASSRSSF